jgi:hypothetical protein
MRERYYNMDTAKQHLVLICLTQWILVCLSRHLGASFSKAAFVRVKCGTDQNCISKTTKSKKIAENTAWVGLWVVIKKG